MLNVYRVKSVNQGSLDLAVLGVTGGVPRGNREVGSEVTDSFASLRGDLSNQLLVPPSVLCTLIVDWDGPVCVCIREGNIEGAAGTDASGWESGGIANNPVSEDPETSRVCFPFPPARGPPAQDARE